LSSKPAEYRTTEPRPARKGGFEALRIYPVCKHLPFEALKKIAQLPKNHIHGRKFNGGGEEGHPKLALKEARLPPRHR